MDRHRLHMMRQEMTGYVCAFDEWVSDCNRRDPRTVTAEERSARECLEVSDALALALDAAIEQQAEVT